MDHTPLFKSNRRRRLQMVRVIGTFLLVALLGLAVIWFATWHVVGLEETSTREAAAQSSRELAEAYEAQVIRNLGAIDQTLRLVKYARELRGRAFTLSDLKLKGLLPPSLVFDVGIASSDGTYRDEDNLSPHPSAAGKPWLENHRAFDAGNMYISRVQPVAGSDTSVMIFSRRLNTPSGDFDGIVTLAVDPSYFTSSYDKKRIGEQGVIGLLGQDGEFRVRRVADAVAIGQPVNYRQVTGLQNAQYASGALLVSPWDGLRRYTTALPLPNSPLAVLVGLSETEQLSTVMQHRHSYFWQAAIASAVLLIVLGVLAVLSIRLGNSEMQRHLLQETYHAASEASVEAFYVLDAIEVDGKVTDFVMRDTNRRGFTLFGTQKESLIGKRLLELLPEAAQDGLLYDLIRVVETGQTNEKEWRNQHPAIRAEWLYREVVPVKGGIVAIVRDISERKKLEIQVQYQATHDTLTGLANRHLLNDRLQTAIAAAARQRHAVWVVFVDLDRFKLINDTLGHKAGDHVLTVIADRLTATVRESDTVSRLGGDEFMLILPGAHERALFTSLLQRIMGVISQPVEVDEKEFFLGCSLGVAIYPQDGDNAAELIERADIAMYQAKESGRNNIQFFTQEMNQRLQERLQIESALRLAIEQREFLLHYQPKVDLRTGRIVGAEALIRWQHPEMGMVSPAKFISLAEESGLIVPIGKWTLHEACRQTKAWIDAGLPPLKMAVNLSARQFREPDLVQVIADTLHHSGLPAGLLEIELTEGMVMTDVNHVIKVLHELKALGLTIAIDDFGTGYSSLSYLHKFPIDVLKVDQSFVRDIQSQEDQSLIVQSVISLAHSLKLRAIAEGVETEAQLGYLRHHGCDEMQGYYFSRPLPADAFQALLASGKTLTPTST
ncbi:bifunctional diguanylate cyclase/phosphodiesterase [Parachitinimonas caeni]|uniref:EAL domain-containing protein n=1 Tax=Parachitinimonas caeni TaxID=3031301 RepID=A0ABT7E3C4_9NEIS|nr:EAL domain-containing protein [Parachitinimonas caeni]MDK2125905.1 EAL domain-containing protein [Parachitinimonas caeni]